MKIINKELIKKRFKNSLSSYDKNASAQRQMTEKLLKLLIEYKGNNFSKVLEIGCGTGLLTKKIIEELNFDKLLINDIVEEFLDSLEKYSDKILKIYGDCENIKVPSDVNLIISNATLQWIENFEVFSSRISQNMKKGAVFAFSSFEDGNLHQVKTITNKSLNYYRKEQLEEMLIKNFKIIHSVSDVINLNFDSPNDILRHLKLSGVNCFSNEIWTKRNLNNFSEQYIEKFKVDEKLILTYKPVYFILEKK